MGEVLYFNILQGKEKKMIFFPGRKQRESKEKIKTKIECTPQKDKLAKRIPTA